MSKNLKVGALVVVTLGVAALLLMKQQQIERLEAESADLRTQLGEIASLRDSNEHLSEQLKAAIAASQTNQNELLRLRSQSSRVRQLEQENAQLKTDREQLAVQVRQWQAAAAPAEQGQATAVTEVAGTTADSPHPYKTELGSLELQNGIAVQFDLGGGTNCIVTPTALADGNNMMEIQVSVTNADGVFSELGRSRVTAQPGQHCSISVGDRMIALAVKLKP